MATLNGTVRHESLHGRPHIVAPMTLIVPGVLSGSKGPLYYPPEEVSRDPSIWNGVPIVVYHPHELGSPVSARSPSIADKQQIGVVYKSAVRNGKLVAEGWFDIEKTRAVDQRILDNITRGEKIELSTGLFTDNEPHEGVHRGRPYKFIARNYRADHLAILPDQKGACSLSDGCGVLNSVGQLAVNRSDCGGDCGCQKCSLQKVRVRNLPRSLNSGRFKKRGSGYGKGDSHEAAQRGNIHLTDHDMARGRDASVQAAAGHNPPNWVVDEEKWEKAKAAADKGSYSGETYWAVVSHIYQKMGGETGHTENLLLPRQRPLTDSEIANLKKFREARLKSKREAIKHRISKLKRKQKQRNSAAKSKIDNADKAGSGGGCGTGSGGFQPGNTCAKGGGGGGGATGTAASASSRAAGASSELAKRAKQLQDNIAEVERRGKTISSKGRLALAAAHEKLAQDHYKARDNFHRSGLSDSDFPGGSPGDLHEEAAYAHQNAAEQHRKLATNADDSNDPSGRWITVKGTPVKIDEDGNIEKGPKALKQDLKDYHKRDLSVGKVLKDLKSALQETSTYKEVAVGARVVTSLVKKLYRMGVERPRVRKLLKSYGSKALIKGALELKANSLSINADGDGEWITIRGTHVQIDKDGNIEKGPKSLKDLAQKEKDKKWDKLVDDTIQGKDPKPSSGKGKGEKKGKETISGAAKKLAAKGYKLEGVGKYNLKTKQATYKVKGPDGKRREMTSSQIERVIGGSSKRKK